MTLNAFYELYKRDIAKKASTTTRHGKQQFIGAKFGEWFIGYFSAFRAIEMPGKPQKANLTIMYRFTPTQ